MLEIIPIRKKINATLQVPGSKSLTNRALLLAALAKGESILIHPLESDDTKVMIQALKQLGVGIKKRTLTSEEKKLQVSKEPMKAIEVNGLGGQFHKSSKPLFVGNAGTAARFLIAVCAIQPFSTRITGDQRMQDRPMKDLINALKGLGANIKSTKNNDAIPLTVEGLSAGNKSIAVPSVGEHTARADYIPGPGGFKKIQTSVKGDISSQFLSALLMVAPYAGQKITIKVLGKLTSRPYVDLTIKIMRDFGVLIKNKQYKFFEISPQQYQAKTYAIEGDASAATYPFALAAITGGSATVTNMAPDTAQADFRFLEILKKMACTVLIQNKNITVRGPKAPLKLKPLGTINLNNLPDAAMTVAILCAFAKGKSKLTGLANLRVKETDRLKALATELKKIGVHVKEGKDWLEIHGDSRKLHGATIETYNDHRMAMCFALVGAIIKGVRIQDPDCVKKTYPDFWKDLEKWGVNSKVITAGKFDIKSIFADKNIVLTGLRGSGKSMIGKKFAELFGFDFLDTDKEIERLHGNKIAEIIQTRGWDFFRNEEKKMARQLAFKKNMVIATGGGFLVHEANWKVLQKKSCIILLTCDLQVAANRITDDKNRPSLTGATSTLNELQQLWKKREKTYLKVADLVFDTSEESANIQADSARKSRALFELIKTYQLSNGRSKNPTFRK